jgi:N utilization substance protein B
MRDQDLVRKIFNDIRNSELYTKYMNDPGRGFDMDQDFLVHLFKEEIANSETLLNHLEEMSINWMDDIDLVCSTVIKTIKGFNPNSDEFAKLSPLYKDPEDDEKFVRDLFKRSVILNEETEALISSKTENWELERIASMDMLLMKMAITEVLEFSTIPVKVTLNEYIEISKFYSTPKSNGFINGILDKVFLQLKTDNRIKKIGRGLLEG